MKRCVRVPWGNADRLPIPEYTIMGDKHWYRVVGEADWVGPFETLEAARAAFIAKYWAERK